MVMSVVKLYMSKAGLISARTDRESKRRTEHVNAHISDLAACTQ